ncbi:MAG: cardiolipin synthase [Rhodothermales bacterium]|nr:cardiolipin synthase [Rhodothermales bacterium]
MDTAALLPFTLDGFGKIVALVVPILTVLGLVSAVDAVLHARTPQGSMGWAVSLVAFPIVAVPLYWLFGRTQFSEYVDAMREIDRKVDQVLREQRGTVLAEHMVRQDDDRGELAGFRELASFPFTTGNGAKLLIDGEDTFPAMFDAIAQAKHYILFQFYILRDDTLGQQFKDALVERAKAGVKVYVLYDEIGSLSLSRSYRRELREAGIEVSGFPGRRSVLRRFRVNFRNHRKIVVVDGNVGFCGGINVGDDYLHQDPKLTPWRDTHVRVDGPMVKGLQLSFAKDWTFSAGTPLSDLDWNATVCDEDRMGLVLASGPSGEIETCSLLYAHAIASAERRVWIATPYFVPDAAVFSALQIAAMRGVDVRVVMPEMSDNVLFKFVPYAYLPDLKRVGVRVFLYQEGFMHQKVLLVDDDYAAVSSANFDNRSFRLNFEITALFADAAFCGDVEAMLLRDLERSTELELDHVTNRGRLYRFAVRLTRIFAPVL